MKIIIKAYSPCLRVIFLINILLFSSCRSVLYVPTSHNVPLFDDKGEIHISGGVGATQETKVISFHTAYALSSHLALSANYSYINSLEAEDLSGYAHSTELMLGYYNNFTEILIFEVFAGSAFYKVKKQNDLLRESYNINKVFIQPALGIKIETMEFALSSKICRNSFIKYDSYYVFPYWGDPKVENPFKESSIHYMLEPAITLRYSKDWFAVQQQLGASINLIEGDFLQDKFFVGMTVIIKMDFIK